jgi:diaminopimelate epimerase
VPLRFHKYEGLGNDFVVVDGAADPGADAARRWCDRHTGIGADGVLALVPPGAPGAARRMIVWNADGSRAAMCGNGIRCVAAYLWRHGTAGERAANELVFETDSGPLACRRLPDGRVRAQMAAPRVERAREALPLAGGAIEATLVSVGNPHAVLFDQPPDPRAAAERLGPALQAHARFPGGVNVEVARAAGARRFEVVVWERGVGLTLACGTGATAVAAAALATGRAAPGAPIVVALPGGELEVDLGAAPGAPATITGPAVEVFSGETEL